MKFNKKYIHFGRSILLSFISGLLMILAFPVYNYYFFGFFALVPLLVVINTQGARQSFICILVFIITFYYSYLDWIKVFHPFALPGLLFYLALIHMFPFFIYRWMKTRKESIYNAILFAVIFVIFEYVREQGFAKFPYGILAYSQYEFKSFIQVSNLVGHSAISFFLYYINAAIADYIVSCIWGDRRFKKTKFRWNLYFFYKLFFNRFVIIILILSLIIVYGKNQLNELNQINLKDKLFDYFNINQSEEIVEDSSTNSSTNISRQKIEEISTTNINRSIKATIIQPWFDYNLPWTKKNQDLLYNKITSLTLKAMEKEEVKPDLVVWPETAIADYYEFRLKPENINRPSLARRFQRFIKEFGKKYPNTQILTGSLSLTEITQKTIVEKNVESAKDAKTGSITGDINKYNSALLIDQNGDVIERSGKKYLVPVAEYFPYKALLEGLPWFATILRQAQASNFTPYEEYTIFNHLKGKFSVLICYEDTFFDLSRDYTLIGADFLVVLTNDAWSYTIKSQLIHYAFIFFRAIENNRYFIRAGNAGVTGLISPTGEEIGVIPQFEEGYTTVEFPVSNKLSFFTEYGNLFMTLIFLTFIGMNFVFIVTKIIHIIKWVLLFIRALLGLFSSNKNFSDILKHNYLKQHRNRLRNNNKSKK